MIKTPRKIGVILSDDSVWEILFSFFHIEKFSFLKLPITIFETYPSADKQEFELKLGKLKPVCLSEVKAKGLEGIIIPGSDKIFNSLCDFEKNGDGFRIDNVLKNLIKGIYRLGKPIGAFGCASLLVSKSLQGITKDGIVVTVGNDPKLQAGIESTGAQAVVTRPGEVVLDEENKIVTCGGELCSKRLVEVDTACKNLLTGINEFIKRGK